MAKTQVVRIDKSLALFQPCDFTILCCHNNSHISCQWTLTSLRLKIYLATEVSPHNI